LTWAVDMIKVQMIAVMRIFAGGKLKQKWQIIIEKVPLNRSTGVPSWLLEKKKGKAPSSWTK